MPGPSANASVGRSRSSWPLTGDIRLDVFAVLFAFGTILHELEFLHEAVAIVPGGAYMERWARAVPTIGWSSSVGLALHLANVAISLYLLVGRRRREGLSLLAVTFALSQLASPNRLASHSSVMLGALSVVLPLALGEWLERLLRRGAAPRVDWCRFTLRGLAWICALTYFFAFYYKLNWAWFSARSPGPVFLVGPLAPVLDLIVAPSISRPVLASVAIGGTLLVELALPVLLFCRRTAPAACLIGAIFHLPMVFRGVIDFPVLTVALYPAFLGAADVRAVLARMARPTAASVVAAAGLTGFGIWVIRAAPQPRRMFDALWRLHPLVAVIGEMFNWMTVALTVGIVVGLAGWVLARRSERRTDPRERWVAPQDGAGHCARSRLWLVPAGLVAVSVCLFAANQAAPFVGLPAAGALIMYSGIAPDRSNHLIAPRIRLSDAFAYVSITRFEPIGIDTPAAREFQLFVRKLQQQRGAVHLNVLRYHVDRICRSGTGGTLTVAVRWPTEEERQFPDACAEASIRWYIPFPIGHECSPECMRLIGAWIRDRLRDD